jgi:L-lactate dehydrogenase complex protein LldF
MGTEKLISHADHSRKFLSNQLKASWFNKSIWYQRDKRDVATKKLDEWETLRQLASDIKAHSLSKLDEYLIEFERNAQANGIQIHWAEDDKEHNKIATEILKNHGVKKVVKSKSMLSEECELNHHLEANDIEIVESDLGERILQFAGEKPSHIVMPAIHKTRQEIGKLFEEKLNTPPSDDPVFLTGAARLHLREKFINADASMSGVNFAIAETGSFVLCTNEGNADLGMTANSKLHIASMGIEKIIPKQEHLGVFIRMLARNATGQPITTYTSHFTKPDEGSEIHIIIVDNNRTKILGEEKFNSSLKCIRCAACMNTCPVFKNSGGHSYNFVIPGPIGAILAPAHDMKKYDDMPFASTLCGSCTNVCPVKINIHEQLYDWRQVISQNKSAFTFKGLIMKGAAFVLENTWIYDTSGKMGMFFIKHFRWLVTHATPWGEGRELPDIPKESFKDWYKNNHKE